MFKCDYPILILGLASLFCFFVCFSPIGPAAAKGDIPNSNADTGEEFELMSIDTIINGKVIYAFPIL